MHCPPLSRSFGIFVATQTFCQKSWTWHCFSGNKRNFHFSNLYFIQLPKLRQSVHPFVFCNACLCCVQQQKRIPNRCTGACLCLHCNALSSISWYKYIIAIVAIHLSLYKVSNFCTTFTMYTHRFLDVLWCKIFTEFHAIFIVTLVMTSACCCLLQICKWVFDTRLLLVWY